MRVTIFGGHGKIALILAPMLVEAGHEVRSVIRNPDHVADVEATGATAVVSSVEDADTHDPRRPAFRHRTRSSGRRGPAAATPQRTWAVDRDAAIRSMDAAQTAGVGRYVMVSFSGSSPTRSCRRTTRSGPTRTPRSPPTSTCAATGLDWTILGPGSLTLEPGRGAVNPDARFRRGRSTSRELVAQVALAVLDDPRAPARRWSSATATCPIDDWLASL